jgi:hypothetical protein
VSGVIGLARVLLATIAGNAGMCHTPWPVTGVACFAERVFGWSNIFLYTGVLESLDPKGVAALHKAIIAEASADPNSAPGDSGTGHSAYYNFGRA